MSFDESVDEAQKEAESGKTEYFKFTEGDNRLRIMGEPLIKVSRFGKEYGICYEGAPYCSKEQLDKEHKEAIEKAVAAGKKADDVPAPRLQKKWTCWILDRSDGQFRIADLPYTIAVQLKDLKSDEESGTAFEGWPMPYDVNIKAKNAGTKNVEYTVIASQKRAEITTEEQEAFDKLTPMDQILDKQKQKAKERHEGGGSTGGEYPDEEINPEDIPF